MNPHHHIPPNDPNLEEALSGFAGEERTALAAVWAAVGDVEPALVVDEAVREALWDKLDTATQPQPVFRLVRPLQQVHPMLRWAVAAVLVSLIGFYVLFPSPRLEVHVPAGESLSLLLPDGSRVDLNSASVLSLKDESRFVRLHGEAYFQVVPGEQPFTVETFNASTQVLGTRFNVRARSTDPNPATVVMVVSGRVRVSALDTTAASVTLLRRQQTRVAGTLPPSLPDSVSLKYALAWRSDGLAFDNEPFGTIFDELERRFNLEIEASPQIRTRPFSYAKAHIPSVEVALADLTQASNLRFRATAQGYEIYQP